MSDRVFDNHLLQTIFDGMNERNWPVQACTQEALVNEGMINATADDEGIILFDKSGKFQWWVGIGADPTTHKPVVKVCGLDIIDMLTAPIENYQCDLAGCLDEIDEHLNSATAK